jgi:hypothetical protein
MRSGYLIAYGKVVATPMPTLDPVITAQQQRSDFLLTGLLISLAALSLYVTLSFCLPWLARYTGTLVREFKKGVNGKVG